MSLTTSSSFYKEALKGIASLNTKKRIIDAYEEPLCYNKAIKYKTTNKIILERDIQTLSIDKLGHLQDEDDKRQAGQPFDTKLIDFYNKLDLTGLANRIYYYLIVDGKSTPFGCVTEKMLYETLLPMKPTYKEHHHVQKWREKIGPNLDWSKIWKTLHNKISYECTKTAIWEQIHLNFFTQFSFNKWHQVNAPCSLCGKLPEDIFHVILTCDFTNRLWLDITPFIQKIEPSPVFQLEMAFGLVSATPAATLRNWLTFMLREQLEKQEKRAYYNGNVQSNLRELKILYNQRIRKYVFQSFLSYECMGELDIFRQHFCIKDVLVTLTDDNPIEVHYPFQID